MPILSNVLIEAADNFINILATDLEVGLKSTYPATVNESGKTTINAKNCTKL